VFLLGNTRMRSVNRVRAAQLALATSACTLQHMPGGRVARASAGAHLLVGVVVGDGDLQGTSTISYRSSCPEAGYSAGNMQGNAGSDRHEINFATCPSVAPARFAHPCDKQQATCIKRQHLRSMAAVVDEQDVARPRLLDLPGDDLLRPRQTDTVVRLSTPAASLCGTADQLCWRLSG